MPIGIKILNESYSLDFDICGGLRIAQVSYAGVQKNGFIQVQSSLKLFTIIGGSNESPTGPNDAGLFDLDLSLVLHHRSEGCFIAMIGSAVEG